MEWHVGVEFWTGKKSEFEFFVVHPFLFKINCMTKDNIK